VVARVAVSTTILDRAERHAMVDPVGVGCGVADEERDSW
jgi:hypothetical protein